MKSRAIGAFLIALLGLAGLSLPVLAQTTGDLAGVVSDGTGAPLPGVAVEIRSSSLIGTRSVVTDGAGRYRFPALPPGTYLVTGSLSGFTKVERNNVRVSLGATATVNISLSVSTTAEVVVTGEAPVVDTANTTIGTTATSEAIQRLPLGRNFTAIATTVAGTGTDVSGGITVYGATGLENSYIVDGINTTGIKTGIQTKQLNNEFIQEVEVKTGGYEAEYGRVLGGTVNVITKSGGNEFRGNVFGYYDSDSLAASDSQTADRHQVYQGEYTTPTRYDLGFGLGGYMMKDRVWFFAAYNRTKSSQDIERILAVNRDANKTPVFTTNVDETTRNLFSGKLTFRLGEANTIAASVFGDPGTFDGQLSAVPGQLNAVSDPGPDSARLGNVDIGSADYSIKYDGIFGTQFLVQAQYGYHKDNNKQDSPYANTLYREIQQAGYANEALPGSGPLILYDENYQRHNVRLAGTFFLGAHEAKAGIDLEFIDSSFSERYGGTDRLRLRLTAAGALRNVQHRYFAVTPIEKNCIAPIDPSAPFSIQNCNGYRLAATVDNNPKTDNIAFYVQDSWKVLPNLTVNAGIRYEQQKLHDYTGATLINVKNMWSPRVGVVWDFTNNGKSKFYANYGRFYQTIPQDIQTRALGDEYTIFVRNDTTNAADPINTAFPYASVQGGELTQDGLKGMYQDELIGGVEYEFAPNWAVGVKGIYRALGRVVEDRCDVAVNPDVAAFFNDPVNNPNGTATCALFNPAEGNALGTLKDPQDKNCYPNGYPAEDGTIPPSAPCESTRATRFFRGIELTANHRFSKNYYMMASYLYSKLVGNYSGSLSQTREGGQADPNINADFDYPGLISNAYGTLRNDRTHQFKVSGYYAFDFGLNVGLSAFYTTGRPYSIRGCALDEISCGGGYNQEGYLVARGSAGRLPGVYEADLHAEYAIRAGAVTITPVIDIFNLLNRQGVTSVEELYNSDGTTAANDPKNQVGVLPGCTAAVAASGFDPRCATNPRYGRAIAWQTPRLFRFGARISF